MPFFSIVIPLYNKEKHIKATLLSILAQTFSDFEVIVVNDGSTDGSLAEAAMVKDERIKLFTIENHGVSYARNYGIEKSSAGLVAFLDADDVWHPSHLEDLKNLIDTYPDCNLYATAYEKVYFGKNTVKGVFLGIDDNHTGVIDDYFSHSLVDPLAWTSAVAIPKSTFDKCGYFDTDLKSGEDTDLWIRVALTEKIAFTSKISAQKIRTSSDHHLSASSNISDKINILHNYSVHEESNKSFKTYMDLNRFSIAIKCKIVGDAHNFKKINEKIDPNNLNRKQILLLCTPAIVLKSLKKFQKFLLKHHLYLSAFR